MKQFLFFTLFLISISFISAQSQEPVTWSASYQKMSGGEGEIVIIGTIQKGWHTYSQRPTDAGPIPTSFSFTPSGDYSLMGNTRESGAKEEFVPAFEARIYVFHDKAEFRQKIAVKNKKPFTLNLTLEYMSCNDMMCLPPKTENLKVQVQ